MLEGMNSGLYTVHKYYGEFLQIVPLAVLIWYALRGKTPLQKVAPILLDLSVALGLILYLLGGGQVSVWHPVCMFAALALAHAVAKSSSRPLVYSAWIGVLALLVVGIQIARGQIIM
jgi:hypothetical protein